MLRFRALASSLRRAAARPAGMARLASDAPQDFDVAEKAKVFSEFFDAGKPMWARMHELAARQMPAPTKILDLGCGPGEPACHFAARYAGVPTIASDLAPNMVALAERRVAAKGLANVECMVLDMEDLSPIADASVDLVTAQMAYMFVPDKPRALAEAMRVLAPGGLLVANVWVDFDLIPLAGGMMRAVAGPPKAPPPPNPNSPLSLADARFWDGLLADAGFEFTDDHNFQEAVYFDLGNDEQSFKVAALPIWDTLAEMEASGSMPDAWAKAQSAFPEAAKPFIDDSGNISLKAEFRISVARKPAA